MLVDILAWAIGITIVVVVIAMLMTDFTDPRP